MPSAAHLSLIVAAPPQAIHATRLAGTDMSTSKHAAELLRLVCAGRTTWCGVKSVINLARALPASLWSAIRQATSCAARPRKLCLSQLRFAMPIMPKLVPRGTPGLLLHPVRMLAHSLLGRGEVQLASDQQRQSRDLRPRLSTARGLHSAGCR